MAPQLACCTSALVCPTLSILGSYIGNKGDGTSPCWEDISLGWGWVPWSLRLTLCLLCVAQSLLSQCKKGLHYVFCSLAAWINLPRTPGISDAASAPLSPQAEGSEPLKRLQRKQPGLLSHHGGHGQKPTFLAQERGRSQGSGEGVEVGQEGRAGRRANGKHSAAQPNGPCPLRSNLSTTTY